MASAADFSLAGIVNARIDEFVGPVFAVKQTIIKAERRLVGGPRYPVSTETRIVGRCEDHLDAVALMRMRINNYITLKNNIDVTAFRELITSATKRTEFLLKYLSGEGGEWVLCLPWEEQFNDDGTIALHISLHIIQEGRGRPHWENVPGYMGDKAVFEILLETPRAGAGVVEVASS